MEDKTMARVKTRAQDAELATNDNESVRTDMMKHKAKSLLLDKSNNNNNEEEARNSQSRNADHQSSGSSSTGAREMPESDKVASEPIAETSSRDIMTQDHEENANFLEHSKQNQSATSVGIHMSEVHEAAELASSANEHKSINCADNLGQRHTIINVASAKLEQQEPLIAHNQPLGSLNLDANATTTTTTTTNFSLSDAKFTSIKTNSNNKKNKLQAPSKHQAPLIHHNLEQNLEEGKVAGGGEEKEEEKFQNNRSKSANNCLHQSEEQFFARSQSESNNNLAGVYCRRRRLSYLQSLLLRKWPCLALAICIMSSLIFSLLLSALTVFMMHSVTNTDCSPYKPWLQQSNLANNKLINSVSLLNGADNANNFMFELHNFGGVGAAKHEASEASLEARVGSLIDGISSEAVAAQSSSRFRRLSGAVKPLHYDLFIWPRIAEPFNFTGKVSMELLCTEPTANITFHSKSLNLNEQTIKLRLISNSSAEQSLPPKIIKLDYDKELQHSIVKLDSPLKVNLTYALTIEFNGILADDLAGFYRIRYEQANATEPTWVAATQFQATDARKAFPCFDEPLFKATFSIRIKHWKNMTAISNMPIVSSQSDDQLWVTDTFAKSLSMSTYLVAFAVTNFESRSDGNVTVWARPGLLDSANYALRIAPKILRHFEQFFGLEYPLPKMDLIALPDFNAGAMENWGLITFRETTMLLDEKKGSVINKERVAEVVAHELAHQWFGNLVTPKWWDDIWLNEGFASFVEYLGVDHVEPHWKMLDRFNSEELQRALKLDALSNTHQISVAVGSPEEISELFDSISYAKGACICRMMMNFLTEPVMKKGLQTYLSALKYSNAEQADLWRHLGSALPPSDKVDVANVMNSWTLQAGYPVITLRRRYDNSRKATLEQQKYQSYKKSNNLTKVQTAPIKWEVPITYTWKSDQNWDTKTKLWLHQNDSNPHQVDPKLMPVPDDEWILLNINQVGFYRVNYDERNWQLLVDQLNQDHSKIISPNRAQILTDLFEMAQSGIMSYKLPMEATKYLTKEQDITAWEACLTSLAYIDNMLQRSAMYGDWRDYLTNLLEPAIAPYRKTSLLLDDQDDNNSLTSPRLNDLIGTSTQTFAISWALEVGDQFHVDASKRAFAQWKANGTNPINPKFRGFVYCSAIERGTKADWEFLWKKYLSEDVAIEREKLMRGLACTRESWLLIKLLELTFDGSQNVRRQDGTSVLNLVGRNEFGREIAFNYLRENWSNLSEIYGKTSFSFSNVIRSLGRQMNTEHDLKTLLDFYQDVKNDLGTGRRTFQLLLEEVESNVAWRKRNFKFFQTWLKAYKSASIGATKMTL